MQPVRAALRYSYHRMNFYRSIILAFPANYNGNICDIRRGRSQKKRRGFVRFDEDGLYDERAVGGRTMRAGGLPASSMYCSSASSRALFSNSLTCWT